MRNTLSILLVDTIVLKVVGAR